MDLRIKRDRDHFWERYKADREKLRPHRENRRNDIIEFVGNRYPQDTDVKRRYPTVYNGYQQFIDTYLLLLVAARPRVLLTADSPDLIWTADFFQAAINAELGRLSVEEALAEVTLEALFRQGWLKVVLGEGRLGEVGPNETADPGQIVVTCIPFDDFTFDTTQKRWANVRYACDEYRVAWEKLRKDDFYDRALVKRLVPERGDDLWRGEGPLVKDLGIGLQEDPGFQDEYVTLLDVWVPELGQIHVVPKHAQESPSLAVIDWTGDQQGPYLDLSFGHVPENIVATAPADQMVYLHEKTNKLLRKTIRQAENQKNIPVYESGSREDMERATSAADNEPIMVSSAQGVSLWKMGGAEPTNLQFSLTLMDLENRAAGNIEALAGMGPQSGTLGQDEMIFRQASAKGQKYQQRLVAFVDRLCRSVAHFIWHNEDESAGIVVNREIPQLAGEYVPAEWTARGVELTRLDGTLEMVPRHGTFADFVDQIRIDPYSMAYEPPSVKLAKLERMIGMVTELWPMMQAEGGLLNTRYLIKKLAELSLEPANEALVSFAGRVGPPQGGGEEPQRPGHTVRENVRRSVSAGPTPDAQRRMLAQMMGSERPPLNQQQQAMAMGAV